MGGREEDESSFLAKGHAMEEPNVAVEFAKIRERMVGQRKDIDEHAGEFKRVWECMGKLEDRIRSLEIRVGIISALSACVGGIGGGFISKLFN